MFNVLMYLVSLKVLVGIVVLVGFVITKWPKGVGLVFIGLVGGCLVSTSIFLLISKELLSTGYTLITPMFYTILMLLGSFAAMIFSGFGAYIYLKTELKRWNENERNKQNNSEIGVR